ncbi:MAG TPA: Ig-like domain-containing protein, partial [Anaerolineae bacterium]|nr:Ig-like domain-containing protein [Anaerolineae bacterium]
MRKIILLLSAICLLIAPAPLKASSPEGSPLYLLPAPGAANVSPATSLALRQGDPFDHLPDEDAFTVTGSRGGYYSGEMRLSDDRQTLLFYPEKPFAFDETVTVAIRPGLKTAAGIAIPATTYQFYTLQRPLERVVLPSEDGEIAAPYSITETTSPYVTH